MNFEKYEEIKKQIKALNLTNEQYEKIISILAKILEL